MNEESKTVECQPIILWQLINHTQMNLDKYPDEPSWIYIGYRKMNQQVQEEKIKAYQKIENYHSLLLLNCKATLWAANVILKLARCTSGLLF